MSVATKKYDPLRVEATAEKRFFIDMLTKDIELLPAIADLVDNSVDGAKVMAGRDEPLDLSAQWIELTITKDMFKIDDNSGGISVDTARNYAFRFGRPRAFTGVLGSVGQFGIGMKRAIFKIGDHFTIDSRYVNSESARETSAFTMKVDVQSWAEIEGDWAFSFDTLKDPLEEVPPAGYGTAITITKLIPSVSEDLSDNKVVTALMNELATRHARSLIAGLKLTVNGHLLTANLPVLQSSEDLTPINYSFPVEVDGGTVNVTLTAGIRRISGPTGDPDLGDANQFKGSSSAGWYVYCNDRLLLAADKSEVTGWGLGAGAYHPQYRNFFGVVSMSADKASLLPWNTTKTAVDRDSPVYRDVLNHMKSALSDVQSLITRAKTEKSATEPDQPQTPIVKAIENAPDVPIGDLPLSRSLAAPSQTTVAKKKSLPGAVKIVYEADAAQVTKLGAFFSTDNRAEIGRKTFQYVYNKEMRGKE